MKDTYTNKVSLAPGDTAAKSPVAVFSELMNLLIKYYLSSVYAKRISIIT
jgi:hypothetical protein